MFWSFFFYLSKLIINQFIIGFSTVCWDSLCRRKSTLRWNAFWHNSHENGLYPVCFLECVIKFELWLNAFPQTLHLCGFSPERKEKSNINNCVILNDNFIVSKFSLFICDERKSFRDWDKNQCWTLFRPDKTFFFCI